MKTLRNIATECLRALLAMAVLLLAAQPARASVFLFAMPPQIAFAAPGASEALEVRLANAGTGPVMSAGFSIDLTPDDPAMSFKGMTASTLGTYIFIGDSRSGLDLATAFPPEVAARGLAFSGSSTLAPSAAVGLRRRTYSIAPEAFLSGVFGIGFASSGIGAPPDGAGYNIPIVGDDWGDGEVTDVPWPKALLSTGLLLIGLGAFGRRQTRSDRRRRSIPGIRKPPMREGRSPGQAKPGARYVAV
jgi:hypothetical protein